VDIVSLPPLPGQLPPAQGRALGGCVTQRVDAQSPSRVAAYARLAAVCALVVVTVPLPPVYAGQIEEVPRLLGFEERDVARARRGVPVAHPLEAQDDREIAIAGMIGVPVTPEGYIERLARIEEFKRAKAVRQIAKIGTRPALADFADLELERSQVSALRLCRLGDCDLQLPASTIEGLGQLDWRSAYVSATEEAGMVYKHRRRDVDVEREFRELVEADRFLLPRLHALRERLLSGGMQHTPPSPDFLYWSREKIARAVVLSLTHVAFDAPAGLPGVYAIGSKQLYASHYFYSSLGLTLLLPDSSAPGLDDRDLCQPVAGGCIQRSARRDAAQDCARTCRNRAGEASADNADAPRAGEVIFAQPPTNDHRSGADAGSRPDTGRHGQRYR
jgi:hypothetical protein